MTEMPDSELLEQFIRNRSESAFATLVERHIGLVHSVAARHTANAQHAEDIAQAVFIILARKAAGLGRRTVLAGWLYHTARLTAANWQRAEARRVRRETEAHMQSNPDEALPDEVWHELSPLLDEAMANLRAGDRDALVLRYFRNQTLAEVGMTLGIEERAAQKRVHRALEKLRKIFGKRGVTLTAAVIAGAVSANSVQGAPAGMAAKISLVAGKGLATTTAITTLVKGTMKTMTWLKIKSGIGATVAVLVLGAAATVAVSQTENNGDKLSPVEIVQQTQAAYAALASYSDTCKGTATGAASSTETTCSIRLQRPNQYRVEWTSTGGSFTSKGIIWSDGGANYEVMGAADTFDTAVAQTERDRQGAFAGASGVSGSTASTVPGAFFKLNFGDKLGVFTSGRAETKREPDATAGGVDCYVVVNVLDATKMFAKLKVPPQTKLNVKNLNTGTFTTTLWIGKRDHFIHQVRSETAGSSTIVEWTDDMLKRRLAVLNEPATPENMASMRTEMEKSQEEANKSGFVFTEVHNNIVANQKYAAADFGR